MKLLFDENLSPRFVALLQADHSASAPSCPDRRRRSYGSRIVPEAPELEYALALSAWKQAGGAAGAAIGQMLYLEAKNAEYGGYTAAVRAGNGAQKMPAAAD